MVISLSTGTDDLLEAIDAADIKYTTPEKRPGTVMASAGDILTLVPDQVPYFAALAVIIVQWLRGRASRKISVTGKDYRTISTEGLDVDEFERVLQITHRITAFDPEAKRAKRTKGKGDQ